MDIAHDIKSRLQMNEVAEYYGFAISRSGFMRCPFHDEKTASLKIYSDDGGWHCFGCGAGGTVIDFAMRLHGLGFYPACELLNREFRLGLPIGEELSYREQKAVQRDIRARKERRRIEKAEKERLTDNYHRAFDRWCEDDKALISSAPWSDEWCAALKDMGIASYYLDAAEMEMSGKNGRATNNTGLDGK